MRKINVLDNDTINKIAAGEVIERPMSVIKELVENSIDADANSITVEIKGGGIDYIRVTDNGVGIDTDQIPTAFLRHATSKIKSVTDLLSINSLGFRGEALSSIASVAKVELLSKTEDSISGSRYVIEGGREMSFDDVGIPQGTTFIVRALFYNTPARRKFLKSAMTEASYITEEMEYIMLSHPEISFKLIINGTTKLQSLGKNDLKSVIYELYGRDMVEGLIPVEYRQGDFSISGYVGKPELARGNSKFEIYYVNNRFIKSNLVKKALDEAYKPYLMLHKYPVVFLKLDISPELIDVNVHPAKREIKFLCDEEICLAIVDNVKLALNKSELIPDARDEDVRFVRQPIEKSIPEPFEVRRREAELNKYNTKVFPEEKKTVPLLKNDLPLDNEKSVLAADKETDSLNDTKAVPLISAEEVNILEKGSQLNLFENKFLDSKNVNKHRIIGQLFRTYWLVEMEDRLFIVDQHAAHEKVKYERLIKQLENNSVISQNINPPIVIELSVSQESTVNKYLDDFQKAGFEIEHFGGKDYSIRAVPVELFGISPKEYFLELLDDLSNEHNTNRMESVDHRIATMACKSAVKGNNELTYEEAKVLIDELLTLENPYNCPHGRPTIISYSKYDIERKFKRII